MWSFGVVKQLVIEVNGEIDSGLPEVIRNEASLQGFKVVQKRACNVLAWHYNEQQHIGWPMIASLI